MKEEEVLANLNKSTDYIIAGVETLIEFSGLEPQDEAKVWELIAEKAKRKLQENTCDGS